MNVIDKEVLIKVIYGSNLKTFNEQDLITLLKEYGHDWYPACYFRILPNIEVSLDKLTSESMESVKIVEFE